MCWRECDCYRRMCDVHGPRWEDVTRKDMSRASLYLLASCSNLFWKRVDGRRPTPQRPAKIASLRRGSSEASPGETLGPF